MPILLGITFGMAALDWIAVAKQIKQLEYLAKPATIILLLLWMWLVGGNKGPLSWFALALVCSLAGDIFLMLPTEKFIYGLVTFLLAHLAYLAGLNPSPPPLTVISLMLVMLVTLVATWLYRRIAAGLQRSGLIKLRLPVLVYSCVISLMLLSALVTLIRPEWDRNAAFLICLGALLFFASDSLLAWNRFVAPLPHGKLLVIITYHLGQITLVAGAITQFGRS
ncbi:MAG: lysoplasmalogenase [Chloroflexi bacterium]|nr:lysoplasmalogenase [Chloroflexota bacterium]